MRLAIIDLGSNSARLDIAEIDESTKKYKYIERRRTMARLSEGMNTNGCLQPDAMRRTTDALLEFKAVMDENDTDDLIAVATAAVRGAGNRDDFLRMVREETGIALRVIPGEQEAEYDFLGVAATLEMSDFVIVDTGGGSTEVILASGGEPLARTSIPVGAVNITEQFFSSGETPEALDAASDYVGSCLDKIHWLDDANGLPIVGMGGSIYNLAVVESRNPNADRGALHGYEMQPEAVLDTYHALYDMTEAQRAGEGVEPGRCDTVIAGVTPIAELIAKIDPEKIIVSTAGLKEGILAAFIGDIIDII